MKHVTLSLFVVLALAMQSKAEGKAPTAPPEKAKPLLDSDGKPYVLAGVQINVPSNADKYTIIGCRDLNEYVLKKWPEMDSRLQGMKPPVKACAVATVMDLCVKKSIAFFPDNPKPMAALDVTEQFRKTSCKTPLTENDQKLVRAIESQIPRFVPTTPAAEAEVNKDLSPPPPF